MAERDENVYKAKLAEQAERYDGKHSSVSCLSHYHYSYAINGSPTNCRIIYCNILPKYLARWPLDLPNAKFL